MQNPYDQFGKDFLDAKRDAETDAVGAAARLRNYAEYLTERQKTPGDSLLVLDLWNASQAMARV